MIVLFLLLLKDSSSLRLKYESVKKQLRGTKSDLFKTGGVIRMVYSEVLFE